MLNQIGMLAFLERKQFFQCNSYWRSVCEVGTSVHTHTHTHSHTNTDMPTRSPHPTQDKNLNPTRLLTTVGRSVVGDAVAMCCMMMHGDDGQRLVGYNGAKGRSAVFSPVSWWTSHSLLQRSVLWVAKTGRTARSHKSKRKGRWRNGIRLTAKTVCSQRLWCSLG